MQKIDDAGPSLLTRRAFGSALATGGGLAILAPLSRAVASLGTSPVEGIGFSVLRSGEPFGQHLVRFSQDPSGDLQVDVEIDLQVKLAFVTVFSYSHRNREIWRDGRLVSIDTQTDDNGTPYRLSGRVVDGGFSVEGFGGSYVAPADVMPSSYWSVETLNRRLLLDTQRGGLLEVSVARTGREAVVFAGREVQADRYRMTGDLTLDLWYTGAGEWAKLAFEVRGSEVTYRRDGGAVPAAG